MSEQKQYWKVTDGSCSCIWETKQEAQDMIVYEYDWLGCPELTLQEVWMTEDEFNNLSEFDGF